MKFKSFLFAGFYLLISLLSSTAQSASDENEKAKMEKLLAKTQQMAAELRHLQNEVKTIKHKQKVHSHALAHAPQRPLVYSNLRHPYGLSRKELFKLSEEERNLLPFDLYVPGQSFVSTGPYVGVPLQYNGSDLLINSPSVNTDTQLLRIRKKIDEQLIAMGGEIPEEPFHSHLLLSGVIETQAGYFKPANLPSTSGIDMSNISLDAFIIGPSHWLLGFIELSHDANPFPLNFRFAENDRPIFFNNYTVDNSRVFVNKAFVTIGDFSVSPLYGTFGQYFVPFGTYSSIMVSDPLAKLLARTKARAFTLGFEQQATNAFYGAAYIFRGDSHTGSVSRVNNGGLNAGYKFNFNSIFSGRVGGGVIANLADSVGMQRGNGFRFFERIDHRVPAYNINTLLSFGTHVDFIGEFIAATRKFDVNDMGYDGKGAKPWAFDTSLSYSFTILDNKPSAIGIGYAKTAESLSLGLPQDRYSLVFNTSLWRNTLQSLELRKDINYGSDHTANGPIAAVLLPGGCSAALCRGTGESDLAVTAQFDYYF